MPNPDHQPIFLADYRKPDYLINKVELIFELDDESTLVKSRLHMVAAHECAETPPDLELDGHDIVPENLAIDGRLLGDDDYLVQRGKLRIFSPPDSFVLQQENRVFPSGNMALEGLYTSGSKLCTQCEAQGFRRITWYLDRPDILAVFTVTLVGDPQRYPVMLANGNLVAQGKMQDGRHFAKWHDPFPKPSYLFALVAGDLVRIEDYFTTVSGREVALQFYVEEHNRKRCDHAVASLKKAFAWEEEVFGLEYDLDQYMVVAADDFNMGAMENKGLNVFNSKYVLASPETATDSDYEGIESVIAHEYFHNWTGNRVTCRDWFQLSLKEGLTVFRDQEFSADMTSRPVRRINDVQMLRRRQFPEDGGPMAHAVRTDSYIEINNFYTMTVYEKGAELVRMVHTLLGADNFRKGLRLYLERYDGQAATVEDFIASMAEAGGRNLDHFMQWYAQAGTPRLEITGEHDPVAETFMVTMRQWCPPTPGQPEKRPLHIPVRLGLLDKEGNELRLQLEGGAGGGVSALVELHYEEETFTFVGIKEPPVPSLLRGFSAPVILDYDYTDEELALLLAADADPFARWEAGQTLASRQLLKLVKDLSAGGEAVVSESLQDAFAALLDPGEEIDPSLLGQLLTLPSEDYLAEQVEVIDVEAIHRARNIVKGALADRFQDEFSRIFHQNRQRGPYRYDARLAGERQLKNICLSYLLASGGDYGGLCVEQFERADNMTDRLAAMRLAVHGQLESAEQLLKEFENVWSEEPLVMDKWLSVQATAPLEETPARVRTLLDHPSFSIKNPNRVRSLIGAFAMGNPFSFNLENGVGYALLAEQIMALDEMNPQIAARMAGGFARMRRFDPKRQEMMTAELEKIRRRATISKDLFEVVAKILDNR